MRKNIYLILSIVLLSLIGIGIASVANSSVEEFNQTSAVSQEDLLPELQQATGSGDILYVPETSNSNYSDIIKLDEEDEDLCYVAEAGTCTINIEENCTCINQALSNVSCTEVRLQSDITNWNGTCVNNPTNFNNKILDCREHLISETTEGFPWSDYGIYLIGKSGNTIRNCTITGFYYGIYLISASTNNTINNNNVTLNLKDGLHVDSLSTGNIINSNRFCSNNQGSFTYGYDFFNNASNSGDENACGKIYNWSDEGKSGCTYPCSPCKYNNDAGICTVTLDENCYCVDRVMNNTNCNEVRLQTDIINVNRTCINNPTNFNNKIFDCQGYTIDSYEFMGDPGIYLNWKSNNTIRNCIITDFYYGFYFNSSSNNIITNNTVKSGNLGGYFEYCSGNNFTNNIFELNYGEGFDLAYSSNNNLINNTIDSNGDIDNGGGIGLYISQNNTLAGNIINNNAWYGIAMYAGANNNILTGNTINNNHQDGIWLEYNSTNNAINNNVVTNITMW